MHRVQFAKLYRYSHNTNKIPIIMTTIMHTVTTHMFVNLRPRKAAGKENNKKKELVKDKSKKKLTCLRCCQCATCKRKRFSTKRIEIVLYDPRHLLDAKSTNSNTPSDEPVTRSPPPDLIPYLFPQASSCCGTTPVFSRLRHPAKSRQTMVLRNILRHVQNALVLSSALLVILVLQRLVHYEHHEFVDVIGEELQHGDAMGHGCKAGWWTRVSYRTQSESGIYEYSSAN
jgi:hypothetical protein